MQSLSVIAFIKLSVLYHIPCKKANIFTYDLPDYGKHRAKSKTNEATATHHSTDAPTKSFVTPLINGILPALPRAL